MKKYILIAILSSIGAYTYSSEYRTVDRIKDTSSLLTLLLQAKEVIGLDANPDVYETLLDRYEGIEGLSFVKENMYETSLPDKYFNIIVCTEVVEHVDTDELILTLKEWDRILKDTGYVWITTPRKRFDKKNFQDGNGSHWIEYTYKELKEIFEANGFFVMSGEDSHVLYFLLKKKVDKGIIKPSYVKND